MSLSTVVTDFHLLLVRPKGSPFLSDQLVILKDALLSWAERERPLQPAARALRLQCLKLRWTHGATCARGPSAPLPPPSPSTSPLTIRPSAHHPRPAASAARCCSLSSGFAAVLNGSRRAHPPAIRDDRTRAGLRLDAVPEAERQAAQTGCWTSAALKVCGG